jgi:LuxR family transcriptional regulator, maltose regulon positive regulatory protein
MAQLLLKAARRGIMPDYAARLLAAFQAEPAGSTGEAPLPGWQSRLSPAAQLLVEPLSPREHEVLRLIARGLSNREIGERLFLAINTVKGHNRTIFGKLQVENRTEAVARARELGLL